MSVLRSTEMTPQAEPASSTEPLPLFRPEVLCKQERFFGEVLSVRPLSFGFFGWLVIGVALTSCLLLFGVYSETAPVSGILLRSPTSRDLRFASPKESVLIVVPHLQIAVKPGTHIEIRCLHCVNPVARIAAIVQSVSNFVAPAGEVDSHTAPRQMVEVVYDDSATPSVKQLLGSGTAVELVFPNGKPRLYELFKPSSISGKSLP